MGARASDLSGSSSDEPDYDPAHRTQRRGGAVEGQTPRPGEVELGQMGPAGARIRRDSLETEGRDGAQFQGARLEEPGNIVLRRRCFINLKLVICLVVTLLLVNIMLLILRRFRDIPEVP